ncbi:ABC transporter permease [Niabella beijingensis]|uniref:ABC transporter permease n=1 Tax=Niabella beijingensis TaxID=2872700 RepID=UPI001CBCEEC4|nr:ABC transporter permease [Niabella beijingensis]MBZ4191480.1 ABC transporter permease [Niabella beijingensis]
MHEQLMIKNYFTTAWRSLLKNKIFAVLNIAGLTVGMASALMILLWAQHETSVDRFHSNLDRIYQVWSNDTVEGTVHTISFTPEIMAPSLKTDFPEVERVSRLEWTRNLLTTGIDKNLMSTGAVVDPDFLFIFSFSLAAGNKETALNHPNSIVVTETFARKLYGKENVIGKTLQMGHSKNYTITGVLKDLPENTQFKDVEYLLSYNERSQANEVNNDWSNFSVATFVLLKHQANAAAFNRKIKKIVSWHTSGAQKTDAFIYPVSKLHLYADFENGKPAGGQIILVRAFTAVAVIILLIACINFMNLSTARSEKRLKEIGVRKAVGAGRSSLIAQFLVESLLITFVAAVLAIVLASCTLPFFSTLTGKMLHIDYGNGYFILALLGFILVTGLLAGSYPALFLSAFRPVAALKGNFFKLNAAVTPRKILVVIQFSVAIVLVAGTVIIIRQISHAQERNKGYDMEQLVTIVMNDRMQQNFPVIKQELLQQGIAISVARGQSPLTQNWSYGNHLQWQGKPPGTLTQINRYTADADLVKTTGMRLMAGRDIDILRYAGDSTACLINAAALKLMQFKQPIGQVITDDDQQWHVVGVVEDFIQESPYQSVKPLIIRGPKLYMGVMLVRLNGGTNVGVNLMSMERVLKKYNPGYPFEYRFTDEEFATKFENEQLIRKLAAMFTGLVIFISCLGLFGLMAYMAESRIKEIGIRKVLGASALNIIGLLSKDFVRLVLIAFTIAIPVSWLLMQHWLAGFTYRVAVTWDVFIIAGSVAVLATLMTVSLQAIKAALANPVAALRNE